MPFRSLDGFVELLADVPWFESVGSVSDASVAPVKDWKEASQYICDQLVWLNFRNAISNRHHELWDKVYAKEEHYRRFEGVERHVKKILRRKAVKKIDDHLTAKQKKSRPSASFLFHVQWDLNFIGFEYVCQDDSPPLFFLPSLLPVYQGGNFPCGWRGTMIKSRWAGKGPSDLPKGRLRVL